MEASEFEDLMLELSKIRKIKEIEQVEDEEGKVIKKTIHIREVPENPDAVRWIIEKYGKNTGSKQKVLYSD